MQKKIILSNTLIIIIISMNIVLDTSWYITKIIGITAIILSIYNIFLSIKRGE